jgi:hypothetical protein
MPYYVVLFFSTANDNTIEGGVCIERLIDFDSKELYETMEENDFEDVIPAIDKALPEGVYIDDPSIEPVEILGEIVTQKYQHMKADVITIN